MPKSYNAGFVAVNDQACALCHQDAGRPFEDYYFFVTLYGELWGGDETFTWHPFETSKFVASDGRVLNFNYDHRKIRQDFVAGGVIEQYSQSKHPATVYKQIVRSWTNFKY